MEATDPVLSFAMTVVACVAVAGVGAGVRHSRVWGPWARMAGYGFIGLAVALLVFMIQSLSVGASLGGIVLAAAAGGMALLVLVLVGSV